MMTAQNYTRGLGVYPGDPRQFFGPSMAIDSTNYRNLALRRAAYHSSSYDYNLTATLITDGIKDTRDAADDRGFDERRRPRQHPRRALAVSIARCCSTTT